MTRHTPRPGFYRTARTAAADHAAIIALVDGADLIDARAAAVTARSSSVAIIAKQLYLDAFDRCVASPTAANLAAFLDARDNVRRVTKAWSEK